MNELYMSEAIKEAKKALKNNEMPVGAIIVNNGKIIGRGYNKKEKTNDSTMHAEIIAIKAASKKIKDWRLNNCSIYITMEPCIMCMGAIVESRIRKIVYGIKNNKTHFDNKKITNDYKIDVEYGILSNEIKELSEKFFKELRNR